MHFHCQILLIRRQGFIQDFELGGEGGGKHDGSRMIVACEKAHSCTHMRACLLGVSGGMPLQEKFEFRSSQIVSDAIWDKLSKESFDETCLCPVKLNG